MNKERKSRDGELRSINEDLTSVDRHLEDQVKELHAALEDVSNLLANTEVATVFLDRGLKIKRFSLSAGELLNLIETDIGRPLHQVASLLNGVDLPVMAAEVLKSGESDEIAARGPGQRDFLIKVAPYRTGDNSIAGVNISLSDITAIQRAVRQQSLLVELGRMAADHVPLDQLFQKAAESLASGVGVEFTKVLELSSEGERLVLRAGMGWQQGKVGMATEPTGRGSQAGYTIETGGPVVVSDIANESRFVFPDLLVEHGIKAGMTVVIPGYEGRPFGVLGADTTKSREFNNDDVSFLSTIAAFLGSVAAAAREMELRARVEKQLQEFASDLERRVADRTRQLKMVSAQALMAEENERRRIAEGLHDDVQQLLAASHYGLKSLLERLDGITAGDLKDIAQWVGQALASTRSFVFDLNPTVLYVGGLGTALQHLASQMEERHGLTVTVRQSGDDDDLPQDVRVFLYSAARELLFNVVKHADVDDAVVELRREGDAMEIVVGDKGRGMKTDEADTNGSGVGLSSLQERIRGMGGDLTIESSPGNGTTVTLRLPLRNSR